MYWNLWICQHEKALVRFLRQRTTVRSILSNREYVGDTVNFKTYSKSNKLKKRMQNSLENILIFENTHEALIDRKPFDLVQKHFAGRKRPDKQVEVDKFAGYVFCGDCGKRLYLHRGEMIKPENNAFQCGGFQRRTAAVIKTAAAELTKRKAA